MQSKAINKKYVQKDKKYYLLKNTQDKSYYKQFKFGGHFVSNHLKKELKKLSSSKRRRIIRDWINDKNWNNEISTFSFDKSFIRKIY